MPRSSEAYPAFERGNCSAHHDIVQSKHQLVRKQVIRFAEIKLTSIGSSTWKIARCMKMMMGTR